MNTRGFHILTVLIVVGELAVLSRQFQARARLRVENQALAQPVDGMTETPHPAHDPAPAPVLVSPAESQGDELNRLRSEVKERQREIQDLQTELAAQPALPAFQSLSGSNRFVNLPKESWAASGYSTPEAALESMLWATLHGDVSAVRAGLTPAELERRNKGAWQGKSDSEIAAAGMQGLSQVSGLQILNLQMQAADNAHFTVYISGLTQPDQPLWMDMKLINGEWKSDASEHRLAGH